MHARLHTHDCSAFDARTHIYARAQPQTGGLRLKLRQLKLDNDAVWKREEVRREQLMAALEAAAAREKESGKAQEFAEQLRATNTPQVMRWLC